MTRIGVEHPPEKAKRAAGRSRRKNIRLMKMRALKAIKPTNTELNTDMAILLERRLPRSTTVPFQVHGASCGTSLKQTANPLRMRINY